MCAGDEHHNKAVAAWESLRSSPLYTSNHVLDETWTLLGRRAGHGFAAERALNVYTSNAVTVLRGSEEDELEALRWFKKYADQRVSFTDCLSFALMERHGIRKAFTFDAHFRLAGFRVVG